MNQENMQTPRHQSDVPDKYKLQKRIAVFGVVAFMILVGAYYYAKRLAQQNYDKVTTAALEAQKQAEQIQLRRQAKHEDLNRACIQVITPARNPQTGETKDFPTPCDIPEGWVVL